MPEPTSELLFKLTELFCRHCGNSGRLFGIDRTFLEFCVGDYAGSSQKAMQGRVARAERIADIRIDERISVGHVS
jgi:hypothetical protein